MAGFNFSASWMAIDDPLQLSPGGSSANESLVIIERYIMVLLYYSTKGTMWSNQYNFLDVTTSVCKWKDNYGKGIWCNSQGYVNEISISNDIMDDDDDGGTLPTEIGYLSKLSVMNFGMWTSKSFCELCI